MQAVCLSADPLFVDGIGGDYHIRLASPCFGGGDPACDPVAGRTDSDGQDRKLYGRVDIGADEFLLPGDVDVDGYVNVGDLQALIAAWGSQAGPPASGNWDPYADLNRDGQVNVSDLQTLAACWADSVY